MKLTDCQQCGTGLRTKIQETSFFKKNYVKRLRIESCYLLPNYYRH